MSEARKRIVNLSNNNKIYQKNSNKTNSVKKNFIKKKFIKQNCTFFFTFWVWQYTLIPCWATDTVNNNAKHDQIKQIIHNDDGDGEEWNKLKNEIAWYFIISDDDDDDDDDDGREQ